MYEDVDPSLANTYDAKKIAENQRSPRVPEIDLKFKSVLISVKKGEGFKSGLYSEFIHKATESNNERLIAGARYSTKFYPGVSLLDKQMFWEKITPLLMAVYKEADISKFTAAEKLGELCAMAKTTDSLEDAQLSFECVRRMEECRPNKETGIVKHTNPDGTPKKFPRDYYEMTV